MLVAKCAEPEGVNVLDRVVGDSSQRASLQCCGGVDPDAACVVGVAGHAARVVGVAGSFWGDIDFGDGELVSGMHASKRRRAAVDG